VRVLRWAARIVATIALLVVGPAVFVLVPSGFVQLLVVVGAVAGGALTLWPQLERTQALLIVAGATVLAGLAGLAGFTAAYNLVTSNDLCGEDGNSFGDALTVPAAVSYLAVGAAAFSSPRRVLWGWPLAVLFGFAVLVGWAAIFLSGGRCET
jgi:hypothetical protein